MNSVTLTYDQLDQLVTKVSFINSNINNLNAQFNDIINHPVGSAPLPVDGIFLTLKDDLKYLKDAYILIINIKYGGNSTNRLIKAKEINNEVIKTLTLVRKLNNTTSAALSAELKNTDLDKTTNVFKIIDRDANFAYKLLNMITQYCVNTCLLVCCNTILESPHVMEILGLPHVPKEILGLPHVSHVSHEHKDPTVYKLVKVVVPDTFFDLIKDIKLYSDDESIYNFDYFCEIFDPATNVQLNLVKFANESFRNNNCLDLPCNEALEAVGDTAITVFFNLVNQVTNVADITVNGYYAVGETIELAYATANLATYVITVKLNNIVHTVRLPHDHFTKVCALETDIGKKLTCAVYNEYHDLASYLSLLATNVESILLSPIMSANAVRKDDVISVGTLFDRFIKKSLPYRIIAIILVMLEFMFYAFLVFINYCISICLFTTITSYIAQLSNI